MPLPAIQPRTHGVILTVGAVVNGDRVANVIPVYHDDPGLTPANQCNDAVSAFQTSMMPLFLAGMATDTGITFVQGEGMTDGQIPFRIDFTIAGNPGTGSAPPDMPSNVCGLAAFYEHPADMPPGARMRVAKQFIYGLAHADVTGDTLHFATQLILQAMANQLVDGFPTVLAGGKWYRTMESDRVPTDLCPRIEVAYVRDYIATQRRRLLPRN